jgi:hypothetical protein
VTVTGQNIVWICEESPTCKCITLAHDGLDAYSCDCVRAKVARICIHCRMPMVAIDCNTSKRVLGVALA